jgi:hypothetical protein
LDQARFEFGPIRDVVENDEAPDLLLVFGHERRDGDIQSGFAWSGRRSITISVGLSVMGRGPRC